MSDLLKLAAHLRAMPEAKLIAALQQRQINTANLRDFFDLGEQLFATRSLQSIIASLSQTKLDALCATARVDRLGGQSAPSTPRDTDELEHLFLIYRETESADWAAYGPVAETLQQMIDAKRKPKQKPSLVVMSEARIADFSLTADQTLASLSQEEIDRDCGIAIFETMQAITELVFYLEQHFVREVGRGNVGLPDLKRLAGRLNKTVEYAREIFELAHLAQVAKLVDQRWQLGATAHMWIEATPIQRWTHLAQAWRGAIGDSAALDLVTALNTDSGRSLDAILTQLYPLADSNISAGLKRTVDRGNLIGLTDAGLLSSWAIDVLSNRISNCLDTIQTRMPHPVDRIIVQADLSLVAPGPLTTATEIRIREFADCEHIGFASTYRINALSISLGMEGGLKAADIRDLLVTLSGKELPQPVEYLLRESEERFGRLVVHTASIPEHSVATSTDPILLKSILNDPAMKPFGLVENTAGELACKFEAEVLYFGLREAGFAAIRATETELVAEPKASESNHSEALSLVASIAADLIRMRQQDAKAGSAPDTDDVTRQIQLAIKNKTRLNITVTTDSGANHQFMLEPTGIANGRLRAKDRKADIERTLPLASITQVSLA